MRSLLSSMLALSVLAPSLAAQQWRALAESGKPDPRVQFEPMPPGWHITTGPAANIVNPRVIAPSAPYIVEIESFLFPGDGDGVYGILLGGENLANPRGAYTAFLVRRDGSAAIMRRQAGADVPLVTWEMADSLITSMGGTGPMRIVVSVAVSGDSSRFFVNGGRIGAVSRLEGPTDGALGVRIGDGVSVHIARLDVIQRHTPAAEPDTQ
jgi:hypothetical protein